MTDLIGSPAVLHRRKFLAGLGVSAGVLALPACTTGFGGFSFTDAVARLLYLSTGRAFDRMTAPGGFWDQQVAALGFDQFLGARGGTLNRILTSALFKDRLARALALDPKLLLLDEWLAGLNPTELQDGIALVRSLRGEGMTILLVEHVMDAIRSLCDRCVVMNAGRKIAEGAPGAVLGDAEVIRAYLGDDDA